MIIQQESEIISECFIENLPKYGFIYQKNNYIPKNQKFYNTIDYNHEKILQTYINFTYSILLHCNQINRFSQYINVDISNYVKEFSWQSIFKFLCSEKNIDQIIKIISNSVISDVKRKDYLKLIILSINNYIQEIKINNFSIWVNSPIIAITRKAFIPKELLYISSSGMVQCSNIPSLELYLGSNYEHSLIDINKNSYRIIEWKNNKLLIRPITFSSHTIYVMHNISYYEKKSNLFQDTQSLLVIYYYLLKTNKDIDIAKSLGLIKDKGISCNNLLRFLKEFAQRSNYEIEKLHQVRVQYEMLYINHFSGPYYYKKNEYTLIK